MSLLAGLRPDLHNAMQRAETEERYRKSQEAAKAKEEERLRAAEAERQSIDRAFIAGATTAELVRFVFGSGIEAGHLFNVLASNLRVSPRSANGYLSEDEFAQKRAIEDQNGDSLRRRQESAEPAREALVYRLRFKASWDENRDAAVRILWQEFEKAMRGQWSGTYPDELERAAMQRQADEAFERRNNAVYQQP